MNKLWIYETPTGWILARHHDGQYTCGVTAGSPEVLATLGGVRVYRTLAAARARLAEINARIEPYVDPSDGY